MKKNEIQLNASLNIGTVPIVTFKPRLHYPRGNSHWHRLDRREGEPQSRSDAVIFTPLRIDFRLAERPALSIVTFTVRLRVQNFICKKARTLIPASPFHSSTRVTAFEAPLRHWKCQMILRSLLSSFKCRSMPKHVVELVWHVLYCVRYCIQSLVTPTCTFSANSVKTIFWLLILRISSHITCSGQER